MHHPHPPQTKQTKSHMGRKKETIWEELEFSVMECEETPPYNKNFSSFFFPNLCFFSFFFFFFFCCDFRVGTCGISHVLSPKCQCIVINSPLLEWQGNTHKIIA
jgi:hypothetical protein